MRMTFFSHHADYQPSSSFAIISTQQQEKQVEKKNLRSIDMLEARHILVPLLNAQNDSSHRSTRPFCSFSSAVSTLSGRSQRSGTKALGSEKTLSFRCKQREKATTRVPGGISVYGPIVEGASGVVIRGFGEGRLGRNLRPSLIAALKNLRDSRAFGLGNNASAVEMECSSCWIRSWQ